MLSCTAAKAQYIDTAKQQQKYLANMYLQKAKTNLILSVILTSAGGGLMYNGIINSNSQTTTVGTLLMIGGTACGIASSFQFANANMTAQLGVKSIGIGIKISDTRRRQNPGSFFGQRVL